MRYLVVGAAVAALALVLATACASSTAGSGTAADRPTVPVASRSHSPAPPTRALTTIDGVSPTPLTVGSTVTRTVPVPAVSSPAARPVPQTPVRVVPVSSPGGGYVVKIWAQVTTHDCSDVSYGTPVTDFLRAHPCAALTRLLATTRVDGRDVGFAQSTIAFKGATADETYRDAGEFRTLVTRNGTGNIDDLFSDGYRLPAGPTSVPSPDAFLAQAQDNSVTVVDAWYLSGATPENDPPLVQLARDIYLQV